MTVGDVFSSAWGQPKRTVGSYNLFGEPWRRDPARNPMLSSATEDHKLMAYQRLVNDLADDVLKKNQVAQLEDQARLLRAAASQPRVNLWDEPTNDTELETQRIIQNKINAGNRGWIYGLAGQERNRRLGNEAQDRAMRIRDQRMQEDAFRRDRARESQFLPLQLEEAQMRLDTARSATKDRAEDNARQTQQFVQKRQAEDFSEALKLIESGLMPTEVARAFPNLSREQMLVIDASAKQLAEGDMAGFNELKAQADALTGNVRTAAETARKSYIDRNTGWFKRATPEQAAAAEAAARQSALDQIQKDKLDRGLRYDPQRSEFIPADVAPRAYEPLDQVLLNRNASGLGGARSSGGLSFANNGLPIVRSMDDLKRASAHRVVMHADGRRKLNPFYRQAR
jgi:hypothetical protein